MCSFTSGGVEGHKGAQSAAEAVASPPGQGPAGWPCWGGGGSLPVGRWKRCLTLFGDSVAPGSFSMLPSGPTPMKHGLTFAFDLSFYLM